VTVYLKVVLMISMLIALLQDSLAQLALIRAATQ
jgi:hypothetical protein